MIASQDEDDHFVEGVSMLWCPGQAPRSTLSTSQSHKVVNNRNVLHMQQTKGIVISSSRMILEAWKIVLFRLPQIRTERQRTMWMRSTSRSLTKPSPRKTLLKFEPRIITCPPPPFIFRTSDGPELYLDDLKNLCLVHVVVKNLLSILVTDYTQKRRGQALLFSFEYNLLPNLISK